jgi:hypothetical protein
MIEAGLERSEHDEYTQTILRNRIQSQSINCKNYLIMKRWTIDFVDYNENVIEKVEIFAESRKVAEAEGLARAKKNKAYAYGVIEDHRWIKSKVAVILGLYNQYAGMCVVDSQAELDKLNELYDTPYVVNTVDDIPSLEDFLKSRKE